MPALVNLPSLIDDARCFELVRQHRWPEGVRCPHCEGARITRDGRDDAQPHRQRYRCAACHARFDDLTGTVLALSRALGETAPLIVIGAVLGSFSTSGSLADLFGGPYTALPVIVYDWARKPQEEFRALQQELDKTVVLVTHDIDEAVKLGDRVAVFADLIAEELGFSPGERRWLNRAALLHDIGKLGVSNAILDKPGMLSPAEFTIVKEHVSLGLEAMAPCALPAEIVQGMAQHHERLDGSGYPHGLAGERIGAVYPQLRFTSAGEHGRFDRPRTHFTLFGLTDASPASGAAVAVRWGSSNGALYALDAVRAGEVEFTARVRIDTPKEVQYFQHGGILPFVLRQLLEKGGA